LDRRRKLLDTHLAGAVALDLFKEEQARITREIDSARTTLESLDADWHRVEQMVDEALDLAANCREAYERATGRIRRQFNQGFFERVLLDQDEIASAELAEPFAG